MGTQEYNVGIYCRLSIDDGTNNESMSISNQKSMLTEYVHKNGWNIAEIYVDDGWSGVNFDRPSFKRMIDDIDRNRINLVLVKDLSRLGRNYILCGQYTEIFFPSRNVRFIALNDGVDSLNNNNDIAPFKNILNDMYAKDCSVKVRSALYAKARRGEYLGVYDPYGYSRDPQNKRHLVINPEVAPTVRRMFEMSLSGCGMRKISSILNAEGILSPADYTGSRSHKPENGVFQPTHKWCQKTVKDVLQNEMYVGHMVQCRKRSESYRTQRIVWNPKSEWVIVKHTHEGIISQELYDSVQKMIAGRTPVVQKREEPHMFSGFFFCTACGRKMMHHGRDGSVGDSYSCGSYREYGRSGCSSHYITVSDLTNIVLRDIQLNVKLLKTDEDAAIKRITDARCADEENRLSSGKRELTKLKKRQEEIDVRLKKVYEDNITGKLPDDIFRSFLRDYETERDTLRESVKTLEDTVHSIESAKSGVTQFVALLRQYTDVTELNRPMLLTLIDKITVEEPAWSFGRNRDQIIRIYYKYVGEL